MQRIKEEKGGPVEGCLFFAFLFQYSDPVYISIFLYHVTILTQFRLIMGHYTDPFFTNKTNEVIILTQH